MSEKVKIVLKKVANVWSNISVFLCYLVLLSSLVVFLYPPDTVSYPDWCIGLVSGFAIMHLFEWLFSILDKKSCSSTSDQEVPGDE